MTSLVLRISLVMKNPKCTPLNINQSLIKTPQERTYLEYIYSTSQNK